MEVLGKEWPQRAIVQIKPNSGEMDGYSVSLLVGGPDGSLILDVQARRIKFWFIVTSEGPIAAPNGLRLY